MFVNPRLRLLMRRCVRRPLLQRYLRAFPRCKYRLAEGPVEHPKKTGHNSDFPGFTQAGAAAGCSLRRFFVLQLTPNPIRTPNETRMRASVTQTRALR